jgi:hypothetical protein
MRSDGFGRGPTAPYATMIDSGARPADRITLFRGRWWRCLPIGAYALLSRRGGTARTTSACPNRASLPGYYRPALRQLHEPAHCYVTAATPNALVSSGSLQPARLAYRGCGVALPGWIPIGLAGERRAPLVER